MDLGGCLVFLSDWARPTKRAVLDVLALLPSNITGPRANIWVEILKASVILAGCYSGLKTG